MTTGNENLLSYILLLLGAIGTFATTISGIIRANRESKLKSAAQKVDTTDKLTALYDRIIDEMNEKFEQFEKEIADLKKALEIEKKKSSKYETKIHSLQRAGNILINAFEQAFKTREKMADGSKYCDDCKIDDAAVLKVLNEYRVLFQEGNSIDK